MKRVMLVTTMSAIALMTSAAFAQPTGSSTRSGTSGGDAQRSINTDGAGNASPNSGNVGGKSAADRPRSTTDMNKGTGSSNRSGGTTDNPQRAINTDGAGNASPNSRDAGGKSADRRSGDMDKPTTAPGNRGATGGANPNAQRSINTDGAGNASPNSRDVGGKSGERSRGSEMDKGATGSQNRGTTGGTTGGSTGGMTGGTTGGSTGGTSGTGAR